MNELSGKYIEVVIDKYVDLTFDYFYPETLGEISIGSFVKIPFRNFKTVGCVVKIKSTSQYSKSKIKSAEENIEHVPAIKKELMNLGYWISEYYGCPLGMIIKSMVPPYVFKTVKCRYEKNNSNAFVKSPSISLNEAQKNALKDIEGDALRDKKMFFYYGASQAQEKQKFI